MSHYQIVILCCFLSFFSIPILAKPFLILQDESGGITGMNISYNINEIESFPVRPPLNNPVIRIIDFEMTQNGGCQLFSDGSLFPVGNAQLFSGSFQKDQAVALALFSTENGGWIASSSYLRPVGYTPNLALPSFQYPIRDIEYDSNRSRLCVLLSNGDIAFCTTKSFEWLKVLHLPREEAIDFELRNSEIYVLTNAGNVFHFTDRMDQSNTPKLMDGLQDIENSNFIDLELMPNTGFLLLDKQGLVHSFDGAPRFPTITLSVVDMEIMEADESPFWFPPGWYTTVSIQPEIIKLDPQGPEKNIDIWINNAENLASFSTEIQYDPSKIKLNQKVLPGKWWQQNMRYQNLSTQIFPERTGVLVIHGSGSVSPYQGANGSGELVKLQISAVDRIQRGSTEIHIHDFSFRNASPVNPLISAEVASNPTIIIAPSEPKVSLAWVVDDSPITKTDITLNTGELCQTDILVTEGSRISECRFSLSFSQEHLRFLGMTKGNAWYAQETVDALFPLPSTQPQNGILHDIVLSAHHTGSCRDEPGTLVSILFQKKSANPIEKNGFIRLDSMQFTDNNQQDFVAETGNLQLYLQ